VRKTWLSTMSQYSNSPGKIVLETLQPQVERLILGRYSARFGDIEFKAAIWPVLAKTGR